jgi:hypothetical protein
MVHLGKKPKWFHLGKGEVMREHLRQLTSDQALLVMCEECGIKNIGEFACRSYFINDEAVCVDCCNCGCTEDSFFFINSRQDEDIDLRKEVKVTFSESWGYWLVSYVDEDGDEGMTQIREAKTSEEALMVGILLVKENGFIPNKLFHNEQE